MECELEAVIAVEDVKRELKVVIAVGSWNVDVEKSVDGCCVERIWRWKVREIVVGYAVRRAVWGTLKKLNQNTDVQPTNNNNNNSGNSSSVHQDAQAHNRTKHRSRVGAWNSQS